MEAAKLAQEITIRGSIHAAIEALQSEGRSLRPLTKLEEYPDVVISMAKLTDPERVVDSATDS